MRISDWSSDVCSSDLGHRQAWSRIRSWLSLQSLAQVEQDRRRRAPDALRGRGRRAQEFEHLAPLATIVHGDVLQVARRHQPRSEEHTSELQSLMRISYADFCMKKKQKHISNY